MDMPAVRRPAQLLAAATLLAAPLAMFGPPSAPAAELAASATETHTPTATQDYDGGIFDELRAGASVFVQGDDEGTEDGLFLGGEVLFDPLLPPFGNPVANVLLRPRPTLGFNLSTSGGTDQIFAAVTWDVPVLNSFFLEASFGGTVHDGDLDLPKGDDGLSLGCRLLFRESLGLGARLGSHWTLTASVDHSSNNALCDQNDGLTHAGAMLGYRF
jgi:hypothetical protein